MFLFVRVSFIRRKKTAIRYYAFDFMFVWVDIEILKGKN